MQLAGTPSSGVQVPPSTPFARSSSTGSPLTVGASQSNLRPGQRQANLFGCSAESPSAHASTASATTTRSTLSTIRSWVDDLVEGLTMFVGADQAGNLLEVGVIDSSDGPIIIHAMPARPKYLR